MKKYFLLGIKGKGMQALAKYLKLEGNEVEGYDDNKDKDSVYYELEKLDIKIHQDIDYDYLSLKEVIVTPAIKDDRLKLIPNFKYYNDFIADITKCNETICVAGSFGKTTTSTFLFQILNNIIGCNCIIGDGTGFYKENNKCLVLESCEFRKHFLSYYPNDIIITNIGLEHTDCYKDLNDIVNTFAEFCNKCNGIKIIYGDIENIDYNKFGNNMCKFGFKNNNDVTIKEYDYLDNKTTITLLYNNKEHCFNIPMVLLKHQVLDLVACITFCLIKSFDIDVVQKSLGFITIPKYRLVKEKINSINTISDFCGHYAGIKNNLEEIKKLYPDKVLKVIWEPVSYNRIMSTLDYICEALNIADYIYVCDIVPLRENNIEQFNFSVDNVIEKLNNSKYWNKNDLLFFDENDLVVILAPINPDKIKDKIRNSKTAE